MIKSILFDLDGTLRHRKPNSDELSLAYLRGQGIHVSEEAALRGERWEHYYFASSPEIRADFQTHKETFWSNFTRRRLVALGIHPKQAQELALGLSTYIDENYNSEPFVPAEAFRILQTFKDSGYVLGVVSNREKTFTDELQALNLDSYFHFTLAGGEVKSYKPEKAIFQHAIERSGIPPAETVYVGDNYFADILGSLRAGLQPVLYDPRGLFPEAGCTVITSFDEMPELVKKM